MEFYHVQLTGNRSFFGPKINTFELFLKQLDFPQIVRNDKH